MTLDRDDTWTPHEPQALALKELWDQEVECSREERIQLQEGCFKLMNELRLSFQTSAEQINYKFFGTVVFWFKKLFILLLIYCWTSCITQSSCVETGNDIFLLSFIGSSDSFMHLGVYRAHQNQLPFIQYTR